MMVAALLLFSLAAEAGSAVAVVPPDTVVITYVCGNTFQVTSTHRFYYDLNWRVAGTEEAGGFRVPKVRAGAKPWSVYLTTVGKGTVELYSNRVIASARNQGRSACRVPADTIPLDLRWLDQPWDPSYLPLEPALLFTDSSNSGNRYYGNYLTIQLDSTLSGSVVNQLLRQYGMTPLFRKFIPGASPSFTAVRVASRPSWKEFTDFVSRVRSDPRVASVAVLQFDVPPPTPGQWTRLPGLPPLDASRRYWRQGDMEYFRVDLEVHFRPGLLDSYYTGWFARHQAVVTAKLADNHYFIRIPDPGPEPGQYVSAVTRMRRDSIVQQLSPIPLGTLRLVSLTGSVLDEGTGRNIKGGEVCLSTPDPVAARCGPVNSGRFSIKVAPGRAGILSWACDSRTVDPRMSPNDMRARQWQEPFTPDQTPVPLVLRVPTRNCDASIGTFEPMTALQGRVTDATSGRPMVRTHVCFAWPVRGEACDETDSLGSYSLDSVPKVVGLLKVRCDSAGWHSRPLLEVGLYPDTLAGAMDLVLDATGCDQRPVRYERRTLSGHYFADFESSQFVACPSDSWLQPGDTSSRGGPHGAEAVVDFARRWNQVPGAPKEWPRTREYPHNVDAFVRWTGTLVGPHGGLLGSGFVFQVDSFLEVRAPRKDDCNTVAPEATGQ